MCNRILIRTGRIKFLIRYQTLTKLYGSVDLSFVSNDSGDDVQYLFTENQISDSQKEYIVQGSKKESFVTTVKIESQKVPALVNAGASVDIMNLKTFTTLNEISGNTIVLDKSDTIIKTYGDDNPPLEVLGKFEALIESKNQTVRNWFFIVNTEKINILSV